MKIIGISGGSGAGKSTVSYRFVDEYPDTFEILNFDDYQKVGQSKDLPMVGDMVNWDHPDIISWDDLRRDLAKLLSGESVTIQSWSHRSNKDYFKHKNKISRTIHSPKVLIVEGYMCLWDEELRKMFERTYYLDIDQEASLTRRDKFVDPIYEHMVLLPMHEQYVKPTKACADKVIDVSELTVEQVFLALKKDMIEMRILDET